MEYVFAWNSLRDSLPQDDDKFLVVHSSSGIIELVSYRTQAGIFVREDGTICKDVDYWAPLPPLPVAMKRNFHIVKENNKYHITNFLYDFLYRGFRLEEFLDFLFDSNFSIDFFSFCKRSFSTSNFGKEIIFRNFSDRYRNRICSFCIGEAYKEGYIDILYRDGFDDKKQKQFFQE